MAIRYTVNECDHCKKTDFTKNSGLPRDWIVVSSYQSVWNFCSWHCGADFCAQTAMDEMSEEMQHPHSH